MDIQDLKKDIKNIQVNKNVIIVILATLLVLVSACAIGRMACRDNSGGRWKHNRGDMMWGRYDDRFRNFNDRRMMGGPGIPFDQNIKTIPNTSDITTIPPQNIPFPVQVSPKP